MGSTYSDSREATGHLYCAVENKQISANWRTENREGNSFNDGNKINQTFLLSITSDFWDIFWPFQGSLVGFISLYNQVCVLTCEVH